MPMLSTTPQITGQFRQRIPGMTLRKGPVLLVQSRPCPFCDMLFVPVLAVKILSACDLPHRGTPPPCSDKKSADKPIPGHQRTLLPYQHHGESARCPES